MNTEIKKFVVAVGAIAMFAVAGIVVADAPTVVIDSIGPLEYETFPQTFDVTGTVSHSPNVTAVSEITLFINNLQEGVVWNPNFQNDPSATFSMPWVITGPGTYTVRITAKHGNNIGSDEEEVSITETFQEIVILDCPAAPGVAAHLLKAANKKLNSKIVANYVSMVAKHMGPQTFFNGVQACDQADYSNAVKAFLNGVTPGLLP